MPYIPEDHRPPLKPSKGFPVGQASAKTPGELTYQITCLVVDYVEAQGGVSYQSYNRAIGLLALFEKGLAIPEGLDEATPAHTMVNLLNHMCQKYLDDRREKSADSVDVMCDVAGSVRCAQFELYRRAVAPYEDVKVEQNGDVFPDHFIGKQQ